MENHKWWNIILAIIILVFAIWPNLIPGLAGNWIVIIAAIILLIVGFMGGCCTTEPMKPVKKKKR